MREETRELIDFFAFLDSMEIDLDDEAIDRILGLENAGRKEYLDAKSEQLTYEGTSYNMIRSFLHSVRPKRNETVYDLGCGYGRVLLYGALTNPAKFKGIELVKERAETCRKITEKYGLDRIEVIIANACEVDFSDGDIFFLFNPFGQKTLAEVVSSLKRIAQNKNIRIVSWGGPSDNYLARESWLEELPINKSNYDQWKLKYFGSKKG